jgi:hypothetical protein
MARFRTCVDLCGNVRYTPATVNRTGIADMDAIEDVTKPPEAPKSEPKRAKPKKPAKAKAKSKSKKKPKKPAKAKAKKRKVVKSKPKKKATDGPARTERLDMRLTKVQKARIYAKAKKTRRTVTSLVIEAIEKIR